MSLELHPGAAASFNATAESLLQALRPIHRQASEVGHSFRPDVYIAHHIGEGGIGAQISGATIRAGTGEEIGRYFLHGGTKTGLLGNEYVRLRTLVEKMQRAPALSSTVSLECLTRLTFRWMEERHSNSISAAMTAYVLERADTEISEWSIWIPVARLYVQSEFTLGRVTFRTLSRDVFELWQSQATGPTAQQWRDTIEDERRTLQGLAAAAIAIRAEPIRAKEIAFRDAEDALAVLRCFSPANFDPRAVSYCAVLGKEHRERSKHLLLRDGQLISVVSGFERHASVAPWIITDTDLQMFREGGLDRLGSLLTASRRSHFQSRLLDALFLYSRSCLAQEVSDKVIYLLVALESMLLKDSSEPILRISVIAISPIGAS